MLFKSLLLSIALALVAAQDLYDRLDARDSFEDEFLSLLEERNERAQAGKPAAAKGVGSGLHPAGSDHARGAPVANHGTCELRTGGRYGGRWLACVANGKYCYSECDNADPATMTGAPCVCKPRGDPWADILGKH